MNQEIISFIEGQASATKGRSLWFHDGPLRIYLRAGRQLSYSGIGFVQALTISSVEVAEEQRRTGIFSKFVEDVIALGKKHCYAQLQIENAISPEMLTFCASYKMNNHASHPDSFWLPI